MFLDTDCRWDGCGADIVIGPSRSYLSTLVLLSVGYGLSIQCSLQLVSYVVQIFSIKVSAIGSRLSWPSLLFRPLVRSSFQHTPAFVHPERLRFWDGSSDAPDGSCSWLPRALHSSESGWLDCGTGGSAGLPSDA